MERKNAPDSLKWNLKDIFKTHNDWQEEYDKLFSIADHFADFDGKLGQKEKILEYYLFDKDFSKRLEKLDCYAFLNGDIDNKNNQYIEDKQKIDALSNKIGELTTYVEPELNSLPKTYFDDLLKDKRFSNFDLVIDSFLRGRKFVLSRDVENALETTNKYSDGFSEVFDSLVESDFAFEPIVVDGKFQKLTNSNYGFFLSNKDENVREQAYNNLYKQFKQFSKTLAMNYIYFVKMCCSELKLRKQDSYLASLFYINKMPEKLYSNLVEQIDKHTDLEQEYFKLLKTHTSAKNFGFKDVYLSLATGLNKSYPIATQKQIVLSALEPLGTEYQMLVEKAYQNNWIDFCRDDNKSSGGYMIGVYGVHPFVFLNDNGDYDSLTTLAHELGHAMHTCYSNKNQPYEKHNYPTFIAEIASTVNEILLNKHMTKNATTDEEKLFYLDNDLQTFKGTVFRQTMFSEFEDFAFKKIENNEILSPKILQDEYSALLKKHFGNVVPIDENIVHEYQHIPHFYTPYYVFQYATSYVSAINIANKILQGDRQMAKNYKKMLSSGGNAYPTEILSIVGIDLTKPEPFDFAFAEFKKTLDETKALVTKLDKSQKTKKNDKK